MKQEPDVGNFHNKQQQPNVDNDENNIGENDTISKTNERNTMENNEPQEQQDEKVITNQKKKELKKPMLV
ncbi:hypothetical protein BLA29_014984, partial [Euroglyphus maynei]